MSKKNKPVKSKIKLNKIHLIIAINILIGIILMHIIDKDFWVKLILGLNAPLIIFGIITLITPRKILERIRDNSKLQNIYRTILFISMCAANISIPIWIGI